MTKNYKKAKCFIKSGSGFDEITLCSLKTSYSVHNTLLLLPAKLASYKGYSLTGGWHPTDGDNRQEE